MDQLSTGSSNALRPLGFLDIAADMSGGRVEVAIARIDAAIARIKAAGAKNAMRPTETEAAARVSALVNSHEQLREEVAETLKDLDKVIAELDP